MYILKVQLLAGNQIYFFILLVEESWQLVSSLEKNEITRYSPNFALDDIKASGVPKQYFYSTVVYVCMYVCQADSLFEVESIRKLLQT